MSDLCQAMLEAHHGRTTPCGQPTVGTIATHDGHDLTEPYPVCAHHMQQAMED